MESDELDRMRAERDEARDCGQDGVCAIAPGCQRHWEERNRELVRERDEARATLAKAETVVEAGGLAALDALLDALDAYEEP